MNSTSQKSPRPLVHAEFSQIIPNTTQFSHQNVNYTDDCAEDVMDPYSPLIVQDMLQGHNEWRQVQDIVKLTLKAMCDVVKSQGAALRELERTVPQLVSRDEFDGVANAKADVNDVQNAINELESQISEIQPTHDRVNKTELQYLLSNKVSIQEIQRLLESKANSLQVNQTLNQLELRVQHMQDDMNRRLQQCALQKDLNFLNSQLEAKASRDEVNDQLNQKASKTSVQNALQRKVNKQEFESLIDAKADLTDLEKLCAVVETKLDKSQLTKHLESPKTSAAGAVDSKQFEWFTQDVDNSINQVQQKIQNLEKFLHQLDESVDLKIDQLKINTLDVVSKKADYSLLEKLKDQLQTKADFEYLQHMTSKLRSEMSNQIEAAIVESEFAQRTINLDKHFHENTSKLQLDAVKIREEISWFKDQILKVQQDRREEVDKTANLVRSVSQQCKHEVSAIRKELVDQHGRLVQIIKEKVDLPEVQKVLSDFQTQISDQLAMFMAQSEKQVHDLVGIKSERDNSTQGDEMISHVQCTLQAKIEELQSQFEAMTDKLAQQIERKSNIKDVCALLDLKANSDDLLKVLQELTLRSEAKVDRELYLQQAEEQRIINEVLCQEACLARWQWQSGTVKNEMGQILWESQCANSCPENFILQNDRAALLTVEPGLYEVCLAFFSQLKPTIDISVNGETILSAVKSQSNIIYHSQVGRTPGRQSFQAQTSLSIKEYIALPANAQIAVCFNASQQPIQPYAEPLKLGEGFIQLRKL